MSGRRGLFEGLLRGLGIIEEAGPPTGPTFVPPTPEVSGKARRRVPEAPRPRPPGALPDAEFLAACTRCGACIEACPEETLAVGPDGYPIADVGRRPCHLCRTVPCVAACAPGALRPVEPSGIRFGTARVFAKLCLNATRGTAPGRADEAGLRTDDADDPDDRAGEDAEDDPPCEVCVDWCKVEGAIALGPRGGVPIIDPAKCTGCGLCVAHCKAYPQALGLALRGPEGGASPDATGPTAEIGPSKP